MIMIPHSRQRRNTSPPQQDVRNEIDAYVESIVAQHDLYLTIVAEIEDNGPDEVRENSLDVLGIVIADDHDALQRKLSLYKRFQDHPYAPAVPDPSSARFQHLRDTANDLRAIWPAERFATDVLGMELERRGDRFVGLCPFHQERTPSFTVYPGSDTYWCYGCFQKGDGIDIFAMIGRWQNILGFRQQVEWLASFTSAWMGGEA